MPINAIIAVFQELPQQNAAPVAPQASNYWEWELKK
jgi:hypothetical protein